MSSPFPEQVTPGGILIFPQIQSPNFQMLPLTGWQLTKDGHLYAEAVTIGGGTNWVLNDDGLFVYSGTPGPDNLLLSITPAAGTDPYGNAYPQGATIYRFDAVADLYVKTDLDESGIRAFTAATQAGPWIEVSGVTIQAQPSGPAWLLNVGAGSARAAIRFLDPVYGGIPAAEPGSPLTPETWHPLPGLPGGGFAAGVPAPQYRLYADGTVHLTGVVDLTAVQAAGAVIATLPAGYVPATTQHWVTGNNLSGYAPGDRVVYVNTAGNVGISPAGSTGDFLDLDGIIVALDA